MFLFLLPLLLLPPVLPLEFIKRFILEPNSYLEFQNTFIEDVEINFSSGTVKGSFSIYLSDQNSSSTFDAFILNNKDDIQAILCYKRAIINGDFNNSGCEFVDDDKKALFSRTRLEENIYQGEDLRYMPTNIKSYFIDNTRFPNGKGGDEKLVVYTVYKIEVDSSASYFIKTIGVAVALGVILIIFVVGLLYLMIKYKEVKKKFKEEIYSSEKNNDKSFVGGHAGKKKSRDNRGESCEESKLDSSLNNSMNIRKNAN